MSPLAVVTGASSGIGYELAKQFAAHDFALIVAAEMRVRRSSISGRAGPSATFPAMTAATLLVVMTARCGEG